MRQKIVRVPAGTKLPDRVVQLADKVIVGGVVIKDRTGRVGVKEG